MTLIVFKKFKLEEAIENMKLIEKWFRDNPKRKICKTNLFKIKKGYIVEEILKHTKYKANKKNITITKKEK